MLADHRAVTSIDSQLYNRVCGPCITMLRNCDANAHTHVIAVAARSRTELNVARALQVIYDDRSDPSGQRSRIRSERTVAKRCTMYIAFYEGLASSKCSRAQRPHLAR